MNPAHRTRIFVLMTILAYAGVASAMTPPRPGEIERYHKDGTLAARKAFMEKLGNHQVSPDLVARKTAQVKAQAKGAKVGLEKFPYTTGLSAKGTPRIFTMLIDFPDHKGASYPTWNTIESSLFGAGDAKFAPFESLTKFYLRSSYNTLEIKGDLLPTYRAAHSRDYYTDNAGLLIGEALNSFDYDTDFSLYDNNNDGKIDYFMVFWAGNDEGWASFWWSWNSSFNAPNWKFDGKTLGNFSWISWDNSIGSSTFHPGIAIHETGHALGLPDYYDYTDDDSNRGGAGGIDMMDNRLLGDHNAFSKWLLDWITPTILGTVGPVSKLNLRPSATFKDAVAIMPGLTSSNPFSEFYLVQNRRRGDRATSNDYYMPADGLVIWHVDARLNGTNDGFLYNNSSSIFKLLKLMQADGLGHVEKGEYADAADYYLPNRYLSPISTPASTRDYLLFPLNAAALRTGVSVLNIAPVSLAWPILPSGTQTATFSITDTATDWMDVGNAVDNINLTWDTGGSAAGIKWVGQKLVAMYGADSARTIGVGHGQNATLGTWVTGPAPLSFFWKVSTEYRKDWLEFYIDGVRQNRITQEVNWQQKNYNIQPGSHYLMWKYVKDASGSAGSDCGWIDKVVYPYVPFELAVDNPTTTWTHSGNLTWFGQPEHSTWGGSAAQSGPIGDGQTSQFSTTVTGPVTVQFFWKVSSERNADVLRLQLNGTSVASITGEADWAARTLSLGSGKHTLSWQYVKNGSGKAGADCGWVDKISFSVPTLAEGVDNNTLAWTSDAPGAWKFTKTIKHDGVDSVICDALTKGQKATLKTFVRGPGKLKFYWMENKSSYSGDLTFKIDGQNSEYAFGDDWDLVTKDITEGFHTLTWEYTLGLSEADHAAVDQVEFTPNWLTLSEALDTPQIAWETLGQPGWLAQEKVWSFGMDAAQSGAIPDGYNSFLEGMVTGPALLSFNWKVSSQPRGTDYFKHDDLEFYIDDKFRDEIMGEVDWQTKQYLLAEGAHKLTWDYYKDDALKAGSDAGWVDRVRVTPLPTLGEALDNTALVWTSSGSQKWLGQPLDSYSGGSAARSGEIATKESSILGTTVTGPGWIKFYWKISANTMNTLTLHVDGIFRGKIGGVTGWTMKQVFVGSGKHALEWRYNKTSVFTDGQDCGWVDKMTFTPAPAAGSSATWMLYE